MTSPIQQNNSACFNGHSITTKIRTDDIKCLEELTFDDLLLSSTVLKGLKAAGFNRPSPIQVKAIPLGRFGMDLVIQAKSGTGKTCVFSVIALEALSPNSSALQVLILSPTREIAFQSQQVINTIGAQMDKLKCHTFIGGIHLSEDLRLLKECHIAVGSPGRVKFLIESGYMKTESIRLFVLDEADMLFTDNFQPTINWIYSTLPSSKQMLTLSATYTPDMITHLSRYMRTPTYVRLNSSDPALLGIRQFFATVPHNNSKITVFKSKTEILFSILSTVEFQQCLVFSNYHSSAQDLCESLTENGWPAAYIASSLDQAQRLKVYEKLKKFHCRILVSTDLTSRGIDAENVNLVVNMEVPWEHETYLHRIGRAGRFGAYGVALTLVTEGDEFRLLDKIQTLCCTKIHQLPDVIPNDLARPECQLNLDDLISTEQLIPQSVEPQSAFTHIISKSKTKNSRHAPNKRPSQSINTIISEGTENDELDHPVHQQSTAIKTHKSTQPKSLKKSSFRTDEEARIQRQINKSQEINEFVNKLWQPLDHQINKSTNKEVSVLGMQDLLSRYKTDGNSVFSSDGDRNNSEHLTTPNCNSSPDIPDVLKQSITIPANQSDARSNCPKKMKAEETDEIPRDIVEETDEDSSNDFHEVLLKNESRICLDSATQTRPDNNLLSKESFQRELTCDPTTTTSYRLRELNAEFWRLHSWANYYSKRYNELTDIIEVAKAKMDLLVQCDMYENDCEGDYEEVQEEEEEEEEEMEDNMGEYYSHAPCHLDDNTTDVF